MQRSTSSHRAPCSSLAQRCSGNRKLFRLETSPFGVWRHGGETRNKADTRDGFLPRIIRPQVLLQFGTCWKSQISLVLAMAQGGQHAPEIRSECLQRSGVIGSRTPTLAVRSDVVCGVAAPGIRGRWPGHPCARLRTNS